MPLDAPRRDLPATVDRCDDQLRAAIASLQASTSDGFRAVAWARIDRLLEQRARLTQR